MAYNFIMSKSKDHKICVMPWVHFHCDSDGSIKPCTIAKKAKDVGEECDYVNFESLSELYNSSFFKNVRKEMLSGSLPKCCETCKFSEDINKVSYREIKNEALWDRVQFDEILMKTKPDGELEEVKFHDLDVRYTNVCNLKCRSCCHLYSSSWYEDAVALNDTYGNEALLKCSDDPDFVEKLFENIDGLHSVYFAGGEPLLNKVQFEILEKLTEKDMQPDNVYYSTNMNVHKSKLLPFIPHWKRLNRLTISASIDDFGPRNDYLRTGSRFQLLIHNILMVKFSLPNVRIKIHITLQISNIMRFPKLIKFLLTKGVIEDLTQVQIEVLEYPDALCLKRTPFQFRQLAKQSIKDQMVEIIRNQRPEHWEFFNDHYFRYVLSILDDAYEVDENGRKYTMRPYFDYMDKLDNLRETSHAEFFPELEEFRPKKNKLTQFISKLAKTPK